VHAWQHQIKHDQVWSVLAKRVEGIGAIGNHVHEVTSVPELIGDVAMGLSSSTTRMRAMLGRVTPCCLCSIDTIALGFSTRGNDTCACRSLPPQTLLAGGAIERHPSRAAIGASRTRATVAP